MFWMKDGRAEIDSDWTDVYSYCADPYGVSDLDDEPLDLNSLVIVEGDPHQVIRKAGDVLDGDKIRLLPTNIIVGKSHSLDYRYAFDSALTPPSVAEKILFLILGRGERQSLVGDLAEEWHDIQVKHGRRFANAWYWEQTVLSVWPLLKRAARWGVVAAVGNWMRRHIG